ncbi:nitroreductase family protein [Paraliomyxa miuraensis]|uniref:hypothetical protein n=1 Tax=Paraliomyxa miuraensis TaxID=376150 RepID=UPI00224DF3DE|nr:hypothetical protein [Paraliomyxa miuraensis]MCX4240265.1 hypothetical protein [Paraliomyxa miuraensis]
MIDVDGFYESEGEADVPPGQAWQAWRVKILPEPAFRALGGHEGLSGAQLAYLAAFGLLAPTSHNTVPQRFEPIERRSELRVWLDRRAVLPESDSCGRQATISVGCVVANIEHAAHHYGLAVELEVLDTPLEHTHPARDGEPTLVPLVSMRFSRGSEAPPRRAGAGADLLALMKRRKMVRARFDEAVALGSEVAEELRAIARELGGLELHLLTDAPTLLFLGKFQELADSTVFNRAGFARELGQWTLANDDPSAVGMRGWEFGLSDEAARHFSRGLRGEATLLPDEVAGMAKTANIGMRSASAVGVITVERDDLVHRIAAGRAYEGIALCSLRHGLVASMHAAITEVEAPNMALRGRLRTRRRPEVVFRLGRPKLPEDGMRPHASRPLLSSLLLPEG